jgi:dTDP-4-amino-4,6-dideoxygalactose transaminase
MYFRNRSFVKQCENWFVDKCDAPAVKMTGSCTHSLEISALLLGIRPGDEVIMPSYTFVSTANAFLLHGATPVFVDIRPDTMNLDEQLIEAAITDKTRAIIPMHYAGVSCDMQAICKIANSMELQL